MHTSDWSSDVCSSDLTATFEGRNCDFRAKVRLIAVSPLKRRSFANVAVSPQMGGGSFAPQTSQFRPKSQFRHKFLTLARVESLLTTQSALYPDPGPSPDPQYSAAHTGQGKNAPKQPANGVSRHFIPFQGHAYPSEIDF